jgi:PAS domain S-box-containing protein
MHDRPDIQRIFRNVPGLLLILAPDSAFSILGASDDYLRETHTDRSIVGRPLFEVFPDNPSLPEADGTRNLRSSLQRVLSTRQRDTMATQRYDVRLPASAGGGFQERHWSPVNSPVLGEDGEVEFIVHCVEDAAVKAHRNAIDILESITEGFFTLDRQWRFGYVNREAHRILGVEHGHLAGKVLWEMYPGLEGTEFERNYQRTMGGREKSSFTAFYARQDRWYEVTCFPAPEGMSVYFRDVSAQKRLQAERESLVTESERQRRIYETALDSTPDFVYVFDVDHRAIYANAALMKTWGVDDVRGKRWMDLGYEQWHADLHDMEIDRVIATRAPIRGEIPFTGTNGRRVYDYIFAPVLGADGEVVAVAGTTRDITERQASEKAVREQSARLAEADRAKDEFLATLAHELRNPLAPLRNAIELLRRSGGGEGPSDRVHAIMARQVGHLIRLVDDLLEVSRISRGVFSLRKERVELAMVVRNAVETSDPLIQAAGHSLVVDLPPTPLLLEGDHVRLTQVLANLLNNAATYTEKTGLIVVRAVAQHGQAVISVRDDGIGIEADALPRLFRMFNRGDRDSARNQGGLGIGLALSLRLVQMHGGTLEANSDGQGTGSEFTVRLPLAAGAEEGRQEVPVREAGLAGLRVLVIDDNRDAADSLSLVLNALEAEVRVAYGGQQGIDTFGSWRPSVVLLDIGMPGMNGYDVAQALRQGFPGHTATLVALTGWGQPEDRERARLAGFDHHMVKPAEIDVLQSLLASLAR